MAPGENLPPPEQLQFTRAQPLDNPSARVCIVCKQSIPGEYFEANGNVLCGPCAERIRTQQSSLPAALPKAALFGAGAAIAGSIIYAAVAIFLHLEIGIIAILIGYMVGKSIHFASGGGRPQQILAVVLTYFSITSAFLWTLIYSVTQGGQHIDLSRAMIPIIELLLAAPFLALFQGSNAISALISLFIIFIGLRQAWRYTARPELVIAGPYQP